MKRFLLCLTILALGVLSASNLEAQSLLQQAQKQATTSKKSNATTSLKKQAATQGQVASTSKKNAARKTGTATSAASNGDLPMFDLHSTVKTVKMSAVFGMEDSTYEFDRNGRVIKCNGQKVTSFRDMVGDMWNFTKNNGRLTKIRACSTACYEYVYTYNTNGEVIKYVEKVNSPFGNDTTTSSVTILARDSHGNWTKRKIVSGGNTKTESRIISYY